VLAYYEKSTGAWLEVVAGPRETPFPFHIDEAGNASP
jgi:hypothetical protein